MAADPAVRGSCPGIELDVFGSMDRQARHRVLVGEATRFATAFLRWMEGHTCDGLSYGRLRVLETLSGAGPTIMREVATQLGISPRNTTAVIDSLEEARLVARRPHPTDRRATLVELTVEGAATAAAMAPVFDSLGQLFDGFSPEEELQLLAGWRRVLDAIGGGCTAPPFD